MALCRKKGGAFTDVLSEFVGMTVFVFELEHVICSGFDDRLSLGFIAVERISADGGPLELGVVVKLQGQGLFALAFVAISFGKSAGKGDGHRGTAFVLAQAQRQGLIADPFSVNSQGSGKGAHVALQPGIEALGKGLWIDLGQEVVQGSPAWNLTGAAALS